MQLLKEHKEVAIMGGSNLFIDALAQKAIKQRVFKEILVKLSMLTKMARGRVCVVEF